MQNLKNDRLRWAWERSFFTIARIDGFSQGSAGV